MRQALLFVVLLLSVVAARPAAAGPNTVDRVFAVDTGRARLVLASAPAGLLILDDKLQVYRIYHYKPLGSGSRERVRVVDLDNDGSPEIIGIGKPSFGLDSTGNPVWDYAEGCSQLGVGDLLDTPEKEVACVHGKKLSTLAYNGPVLWEVEITGAKMKDLGVAMLDTDDGKEDLEFSVGDQVWRYKGDGSLLGDGFEERRTQPQDAWAAQAEALVALMGGTELVDLDGDGSATETLHVQGAKLVLRKQATDAPLGEYTAPTGAIRSLAVGALLGEEGKPAVIVGGEGLVAVLGPDAKPLAEVRVDFRRSARAAKVEFVGVNAVGFADTDAATKPLTAHAAQVSTCYEKRHRAYSLTRQGKVMLKFDVKPDGRVGTTEIIYTTLNDPRVSGCIRKAAARWTFPKPAEPGAHVTADLLFTWTDTFK